MAKHYIDFVDIRMSVFKWVKRLFILIFVMILLFIVYLIIVLNPNNPSSKEIVKHINQDLASIEMYDIIEVSKFDLDRFMVDGRTVAYGELFFTYKDTDGTFHEAKSDVSVEYDYDIETQKNIYVQCNFIGQLEILNGS